MKHFKAVSKQNPDESFEFDLGDIEFHSTIYDGVANDYFPMIANNSGYWKLNLKNYQIFYNHDGRWYYRSSSGETIPEKSTEQSKSLTCEDESQQTAERREERRE